MDITLEQMTSLFQKYIQNKQKMYNLLAERNFAAKIIMMKYNHKNEIFLRKTNGNSPNNYRCVITSTNAKA